MSVSVSELSEYRRNSTCDLHFGNLSYNSNILSNLCSRLNFDLKSKFKIV
jgi:hypothetical protein